MTSYISEYMGPKAEGLARLSDLLLLVGEEKLPAHSTTLAQHSPVVLDKVVEAQEKGKVSKVEIEEPFQSKSLPGVLLFLKCCYQPKHVKRFMEESLGGEPPEAALHDLLDLAFELQADDLRSEVEAHALELIPHLDPATLPKWVATTERCGCSQLQSQVSERVAQQLIVEHSIDLIKSLIVELSPVAAAHIISTAWDSIRANSGLPPIVPSGALDEARAEAARAKEEAAQASQALESKDAQIAELTRKLQEMQTGTLPDQPLPQLPSPNTREVVGGELTGQLGPNLRILHQDSDTFTVEWAITDFSKLPPSILESPGFGAGQFWRVRFAPSGEGALADFVGVFLTFAGTAQTEVKYTVSMVNQMYPMRGRAMEGQWRVRTLSSFSCAGYEFAVQSREHLCAGFQPGHLGHPPVHHTDGTPGPCLWVPGGGQRQNPGQGGAPCIIWGNPSSWTLPLGSCWGIA